MNKKEFTLYDEYPGYFTVINPASGNEYNVVYRGHKSPWNYFHVWILR